MVHRLPNDREPGSGASPSSDRGIGDSVSLNRRDCVRLGAAAVGLAGLGTNAAASSGSETEFVTDFGEYGR